MTFREMCNMAVLGRKNATDPVFEAVIIELRDERNWPLVAYRHGHFVVDHKKRHLEVTILDKPHGHCVTIPYEEYEQALMQLALQGEA